MSEQLNTKQTLLMKLQTKQDDQSWEEFTGYYKGYIYAVLKSFILSNDECDDLVQDILLKVWKALPDYNYEKEKCRFRTWLAVIIKNTAKNHFRRRNKFQNSQEFEASKVSDGMMTESEIDKIAEDEWKAYIGKMAWDKIKPELSELAIDIFEESLKGHRSKELADRFDLAISSVRVYKMRVRKALHKEISRLNMELGG